MVTEPFDLQISNLQQVQQVGMNSYWIYQLPVKIFSSCFLLTSSNRTRIPLTVGVDWTCSNRYDHLPARH